MRYRDSNDVDDIDGENMRHGGSLDTAVDTLSPMVVVVLHVLQI